MSGRRLLTRLLLVPATLLLAVAACATPVEPDMKQLLKEQPPPASQFGPARAGWYASEASRPAPNPELESFSAAATARAAKATLKAAAVPHPLALAGVIGMIFLLRRLRTMQPA